MNDCKQIEVYMSDGRERLLSVTGDFGLFREFIKSLIDSKNEDDPAKPKSKPEEPCNIENEAA